ncbi:MAG: hypothetical protein NTW33_10500, partial [Methanoregula sp.]|nr:hypothetical protein [Methanoregula sp.]
MARRGGEETPIPKKTCFVICPIGDEGGDERKWSDDLLDCIITPVVEKMGYQKPIRADHINESGIITRQIIDLLIESDLVIADLSYRNPNVCYELAVRHVAKRPFIHMIKNGHKIPFDTASNRAITVDIDIRSANKAKKELERHISSIESGNIETDNPIGTALTLRDLKSSGDPSQMMSANLMEAIQNIATEVKALRDVRLNPYQIVGRGVNLAGLAPVMSIRLNDRQGELMKQYFEVSRKILDQK